MEDAPLTLSTTQKETHSESFEIKQDEKIYKLKIEIINQDITLNLLDEKELMKEYEIKLTLEELKQIHKLFSLFGSSQEFIDFMKAIIENKKILIKKNDENQITIELMVEYLFKKNIIKIDLIKKKINFELVALDLYKKIDIINKNYNNLEINFKKFTEENKFLKNDNINTKEEIKALKNENKNLREENNIMKEEIKKLKEEIKNIKEENKMIKDDNNHVKNKIKNLENLNNSSKENLNYLNENNNLINDNIIFNSFNSTIIEKNEVSMIHSTIKERMNREIKEIKKIYQATVDGGDSDIFHKKCDNISNTLVLYKTKGNRRFGGFASESWNTGGGASTDEKCFLFSLDKKKIYLPKNDYFEIVLNSFNGPSFSGKSGIYIIEIYKNALKKKSLRTNEKKFKDIFDGDINALSEDGELEGVFALEYEVFQILFN